MKKQNAVFCSIVCLGNKNQMEEIIMRRIISVLLSVVIVFSVNAFAFADASISRRSSYATDKYSGKIGIASVYASSELIYEGKTFRAGYAVDNDTSTCWQEGAYGWGVGETITLQFDGYYDVRIYEEQWCV